MNAMHTIHVLARDGRLTLEQHAEYFRSEGFAERLKFKGAQGLADQVGMVLYMLERVALDPREAKECLESVEQGTVALVFFGWVCPVIMLKLEPGEELDKIKAAVVANMNGPLMAAAQRVLKWRGRENQGWRGREKVMNRLRQSMVWPHGSDQAARKETDRLVSILHAKADALQALRRGRLRALARAAGPHEVGWTQFINAMAVTVLAPVETVCA